MQVQNEVLAYKTRGIIKKLYYLFAAEGGHVVAPLTQKPDFALVSLAHQFDEIVEKLLAHPAYVDKR